MSQKQSDGQLISEEVNPWLLWITFFSALLIFISLWVIAAPAWHLTISILTIIALWFGSSSALKTLGFVIGLVAFLAALQIIFSPFMRAMFIKSLNEGFHWADWQYLMLAVERFAWPLMIVSLFETKLSNPAVASHLTNLLAPLKYLGLKIAKLQVLILLALRFLPSLRREWNRFAHFQTFFTSRYTHKSLLQKLSYSQGVLKALIAHTIHRAVGTGDMLALRGLPTTQVALDNQKTLLPILIWLSVGVLFALLDLRIAMVWLLMSSWMGLSAVTIKSQVSS